MSPIPVGDELKNALLLHYDKPPIALGYIAELRKSASPDICPMCGSPNTGTLDHYLPKKMYPEFAIFSQNLVPACNCNSSRNDDVKGAAAGDRVLHPYFDDCMTQRLVTCSLTGDLNAPAIQLVAICGDIPERAAVIYHMEVVLKRTRAC